MQLPPADQARMDEYEAVERRNLARFVAEYEKRHTVLDYYITNVQERTRYDAWIVVQRPTGRVELILLEAKVRPSYTTTSFPDTVLTKSKYVGLLMHHKRFKFDKTLHLAFYEDGLFIYDLTPEILGEKELVEVEIHTKEVQSDADGDVRPEWKYQMLHAGPQSTTVKGFPIQR